jgi:hypothetical protein
MSFAIAKPRVCDCSGAGREGVQVVAVEYVAWDRGEDGP